MRRRSKKERRSCTAEESRPVWNSVRIFTGKMANYDKILELPEKDLPKFAVCSQAAGGNEQFWGIGSGRTGPIPL